MSGKIRNDLTGKKYGMITVIRRSEKAGNGKKPKILWECICDCGKETIVSSSALLTGHTVSCGCKKIKHGFSNKERLYNIWKGMRQRCNNPNNPSYEHYGGRGISICDEWNDYANFRNWAYANCYDDTLSIDRINNDGNYDPTNCRWVNNEVQTNNQSKNRMIEYNGCKYTMSQLAKELGLSYSSMQHRIERGWIIERIVNQKQRKSPKKE